jgi:hypothetical protein
MHWFQTVSSIDFPTDFHDFPFYQIPMINQWELDAFLWPEISGDAGDGHCPNRPEVTNFALSVILWILAMQSIQFVSYVPRFERNCHRISNPR